MMLMSFVNQELEPVDTQELPPAVAMVMSAMEAGEFANDERRALPRIRYRTTTQLRLFRDQPATSPWRLFTKDVNRRGLGFITQHRLPLGYGGIVALRGEDGATVKVQCTLSRCREATPGWFDGCLHFNREQPQFDR